MNLTALHIKRLIFVCLLTSDLTAYTQDITLKVSLDTFLFQSFPLVTYQSGCTYIYHSGFNYIYHSPGPIDEQRYKTYKSLIGQQPTVKNHKLYFDLARSLWELEKTADAEKMFLTIIKSKEKCYSSTYYHSSDIAGDKTKNFYGYGNFTSNYKNYSAIYLTKIYLEQKMFNKAVKYLNNAVKKYKVSYTCGKGFQSQKDEYDFLYAACYKGLKNKKKTR